MLVPTADANRTKTQSRQGPRLQRRARLQVIHRIRLLRSLGTRIPGTRIVVVVQFFCVAILA
jgi:hypothetical protein